MYQLLDSWLVCKIHIILNPRFKNNVSFLTNLFMLSIDLIRAPSVAARGHQYIIIAVDYLTKWVETASYPLDSAKVTSVFLLCPTLLQYGSPHVPLPHNVRKIYLSDS